MIKTWMVTLLIAFLFTLSVSSIPVGAEENSSTSSAAAEPKEDEQKKEKRGEWLAAPIPISSPAIGAGLEWVVGYVFPFSKQDKVSPNSAVGVGGLFTNNGSRGLALAGRLYVKQDKYRFTAAVGGAKINADVYGIGKLAGDRGLYVPLNGRGSGFIGETLFRIRKGFYIGPRFQYRNMRLSLNREKLDFPVDSEGIQEVLEELNSQLLDQRTVAIGPHFQMDTRDSTYYPRKGIFLDSGADFFSEGLGSKFTYQYYKAAFNKYAGIGTNQVFAFRGMACAAAGDHVPIYDLCLYGSGSDLRGYSAGRYQDRRMFATQAEYRLNMPAKKLIGRFGLVAFGGVGGVGNNFGDIGWSDLLPAGGGGLRFRLTKKEHINFRVDYAVGRVGHTLTIGIGEAF